MYTDIENLIVREEFIMFKKLGLITIIWTIFFSYCNLSTFTIRATENKPIACSSCSETIEPAKIKKEYINNNGSKVIEYVDGVSVEFFKNGTIELTDKYNVTGINKEKLPIVANENARIPWKLIAKLIWSALSVCSVIPYALAEFGSPDICRIFLSYMGSPKPNTKYNVYAFKEPYHVPGCYPSSQPQCIQYNIKYRFVIMN